MAKKAKRTALSLGRPPWARDTIMSPNIPWTMRKVRAKSGEAAAKKVRNRFVVVKKVTLLRHSGKSPKGLKTYHVWCRRKQNTRGKR